MPLFRASAPGIIGGSAGGAPGAMPLFGIAAAGLGTATLAPGPHQPIQPTVSAGDLMLCCGFGRNDNANVVLSMSAGMTGAGWQHVSGSPWTRTGGNEAFLVAWKIADGTEDNVAVPGGISASGGTSADGFYGRCVSFTATNGFHTSPIVNPVVATLDDTFDTTITLPTVVPSGTNQLAVAAVGHRVNTTLGDPTNETGGAWNIAINTGNASAISGLALLWSNQSGGGTIVGGTSTAAVACIAIAVGFALRPADV